MIAGALQSLSFSAPWMLTGLFALPLIWWLLRATPPRPDTVSFPPTSILIGLKHREKTPVRSPWWLTLLRMAVVAAVIGALAGPHVKPQATAATSLPQPLLVVVDNGWPSASRWAARRTFAEQLAVLAEDGGQTLYLATTAGPTAPLQPLTPVEFRQRFASLNPQPFPGDRAGIAAQIARELDAQRGKIAVAWLADGVEDSGAAALHEALSGVAAGGVIDIYGDSEGAGALALTRAASANAGPIRAKIMKAEPSARGGQVAAVTARGERLSVASFDLRGGGASSAEVAFDLPLDLRNQIARLEIVGEASAGGVFLLDGRSQRRRVGLVATEGTDDAQPLLSPTYYLERALTPFAEIVRPRTANLDVATADLVAAKPSVIILSDVGRLSGAVRERLRAFVEEGGMLIRFAGPRLEQGGDSLLPAPLREGGRTLGGAMTWTSPQTPAPFEEGSPFNSLTIPKDVVITRQVLADPAQMPRETQVWARLSDGTPLVTAAKRGAGTSVFFHITANPDWSNLTISGLFVEMMRKTLEMSPLQLSAGGSAEAVSAETLAAAGQDASLKPWRVLDGFGKLGVPGERAQPVTPDAVDTARVSAANPPGLYGPQNAVRAINTVRDVDTFAALKTAGGARFAVFTEAKTVALAPWLFLAALCLFLLDGIACALFLGRSAPRWRKPAAAVLALGLAFSFSFAPETRAEARAATPAAPTSKLGLSAEAAAFAMAASLETRFAYVLTGDAEADRVSQAGLAGLSRILYARTAVEPGEPIAVDPAKDELVFFPLIYWPVLPNAEPLPDHVLAKVDAYMKQGGLIIFDTKNDEASPENLLARSDRTPLAQLLGKLDIPPLQRLPDDHVLTRSFYLLQSFPGRWDNGDPWVEARHDTGDAAKRGVKSDGVSSIIVTSNDLASAWAMDDSDRPMFAVVPGGEDQREMSYRVGVNIAMYALTGNYKADQVHVPAILERLGH